MLLFPEKKDVAGMIDWFEKNYMFPFPEPESVEYHGKTPDPDSQLRINYGNQFTIVFQGVGPIHDVFRCDLNQCSRIRVMRRIRECILEGNYRVEEGELLPFTTNRLTVFARSQECTKVVYE